MASRFTDEEFLTTGQAARLCSVTPDAVLKWIKAGRISARRTGGGHFRIPASQLVNILGHSVDLSAARYSDRRLQFCWEYHADNHGLADQCRHCLIYRSRAGRCYELARLPDMEGRLKLFCSAACEQCDYYAAVKGARLNVLVASDQPDVTGALIAGSGPVGFNLRTADCEYNLAVMVGTFFPDFVVIDCSMGIARARQTAKHILGDFRAPFTRVVMAGEQQDFPADCDRDIFAYIARPLTIPKLESLIARVKKK